MVIRAFLLSVLVRLLALTWRIERFDPKGLFPTTLSGGAVLALLHGEQLPLLLSHRSRRTVLMVSASRDGEWLVQAAKHLGYRAIRGSTSRKALSALLGARRALNAGDSVAVAVDGPRGPRGIIQPGAQHLASRASVPLIAIRARASRAWHLSSWDRFMIPKPFAKIRLEYDDSPDLSSLKIQPEHHEHHEHHNPLQRG